MKTIKLTALIFTSILFFTSCHQQDKLVGKWERIGDQYQGLQLEVTSVGDKFVGKLIYITDTAKHFGLELQDVKWKEIEKMNDTVYEFKDLAKGYDFFNKVSVHYDDASLLLTSNDTIKIRQDVKANELWGTQQIWFRLPK